MSEPQTIEGRNALRIAMKWYQMDRETAMAELPMWEKVLAEARAIVREEHGAESMQLAEVLRQIHVALGYMTEDSGLKPSLDDVLVAATSLRRQLDEAKAKLGNPRAPFIENELAQVRADIARTAAVVTSLRPVWQRTVNGETYQESGDQREYDKQMVVLCSLLSRERELTAKSEPEGGK